MKAQFQASGIFVRIGESLDTGMKRPQLLLHPSARFFK